MAQYLIASEEGAQRYGNGALVVGDPVELTLDEGEELAVIAAGWIEPAKEKKEAN